MSSERMDFRPAALLVLGVGLVLTGCDSGGSATATGGVTPGLEADYGMRWDLKLTNDVPSDVRAFDVDGDGLSDIVVANSIARDISISFGQPDGTFGTPITLQTSGVPWRTEFGDFNNDGLSDVAALTLAGNGGATAGLDVFLQGPNPGEFGPVINYPFTGAPNDLAVAPRSGIVGDPVQDDIFVTIAQTQQVERLRLDSSDNLQLIESLNSKSLGGKGRSFSVAVFDEYSDGTVDLTVAEAQIGNSELGRVVVYPRVGEGFDDPKIIYEPVYWPTVDNVGDVDGDGTEDLAIAQVDGSDVIVLLGTLVLGANPTPLSVTFGPGSTMAVFPDLNGDGRKDAAAPAFEEAALYVRLADGPLSWGPPTRYDVGYLPRSLSVTNLPGDSLPDLVVSNIFDTAILENVGDGKFRAAVGTVLSQGSPIKVRTGDLDKDGDLDAVVLTTDDPAVLFLTNDGKGNFTEVLAVPIEGADPDPFDMILADGDGDTYLDPIVTLSNLDQVRLFHNPFSPLTFVEPALTIKVGKLPRGLAAADITGNGQVELIVALAESQGLQVWVLDQGTYLSAGVDPLSSSPLGLRLADLDGDLDLDAVITAGDSDTVVPAPDPDAKLLIAEWDGNQFVEVGSYQLDSISRSFDVGSTDLDNNPDIVVGQLGLEQRDLFVFKGDGQLGFTSKTVTVDTVPTGVRLTDVNDDSRLDILIPSASGDLLFAIGNGQGDFPEIGPEKAGRLSLLFGMNAGFAYERLDGDPRMLDDLLYVSPNAPMLWIAANRSESL